MQEQEKTSTMRFSIQPGPASDSGEIYSADDQKVDVPATKSITAADGFEKKENSWFAMSQIPTDLSIQVQDATFYVHKYHLVSMCGYFTRIDLGPANTDLIKLDNIPGGPDTFHTVLRFCYGLPTNLTAHNVAALRCAAEFLEMSEALEDGNLVSKTEAFLTFAALPSWKDSITVLRSCEPLSPWAENLQIVRRCCDSVVLEIHRKSSTLGGLMSEASQWLEDLANLQVDHFTRVVTGLRAKGVGPLVVGSCIERYGERWVRKGENRWHKAEWRVVSGRGAREEEGCDVGSTREQKAIVESLVSLLPPDKEAVSCKFVMRMLRAAVLSSASPALVTELEKRAGLVLEGADVGDLLIPKRPLVKSTEEQNMHDVDVVQRILEYFLLYEQKQLLQQLPQPVPSGISKLLDNYLAEIARDPQLPVTKFQLLAQSLPENARTSDDGLYRAIDTYLKTHPSLSDHERRRLCKVMNYEKLSQDACAHAAQNDRLPLRTSIQVLFSEQVKLRAEIQGKGLAEAVGSSDQENSWTVTNREVKALRIELEKVKMEMAELQRDHLELQQEYRKQRRNQRKSSGWTLGWKKIRKSSLFNSNMDEEDTEESNNRPQESSLCRRQTLS